MATSLSAASVQWAQRVLAEHGPQTSASLAERTGYTRRQCRYALDQLAHARVATLGYQAARGGGRGRRSWLYTLTDPTQSPAPT